MGEGQMCTMNRDHDIHLTTKDLNGRSHAHVRENTPFSQILDNGKLI
jgi:hypothetical protein